MDDSFALAFVLGSPELELDLALATGGPRPDLRAAVLARHLDEAGRGHIPVGLAPAVDTELDIGALLGWGEAYDVSSYPAGPPIVDGVAAAAEVVTRRAAEGRQVVWMILGPSSAAASFATRFPHLVRHVRVVVMGASICTGMVSPWGDSAESGHYPNQPTNERQNVPAARAMLRAPWGGGPPLFTGIRCTLGVKLEGAAYRRLRQAADDTPEDYPALGPLFRSYEAWWTASSDYDADSASVTNTAVEAESVDPWQDSVVMFDVLAAYLAFTQRGLRVVTIAADIADDGHTLISPADAARPLGCNTSRTLLLSSAEIESAPIMAVAVGWEDGQLAVFRRELLARLLRGGRPCDAP